MRPAADVRASALLSEVAGVRRIGVEVGVYRGNLSCRLLAGDPSLFLYMVDPWREGGETYLTTDDHIARSTQAQHDDNMAAAQAAVEQFEGRYEILRMTSLQASKRFDDGTLDWVFIDGDHSLEAVREDIACWWPKIRPRGILSGHDYRDERNYGVIQAVQEFCEAESIPELRLGGNYTWFVTRP